MLQDLSTAVIKANRNYQYVPLELLPKDQVRTIIGDTKSDEFSGVLLPASSTNLSIKAVSKAASELFSRLARPTAIAEAIPAMHSKDRDEFIARLVLESVLELSLGSEFVTGWPAFDALLAPNSLVGTGPIADLSMRALMHGSRLQLSDPSILAARIYFYNRIPATRRWLDLWPDPDAVFAYFGLNPGGPLSKLLLPAFKQPSEKVTAIPEWLSWHRRERNPRESAPTNVKLYISPRPDEMKSVFHLAANLLKASEATGFKMGSNAPGLLRPDKLIVYFQNHGDLNDFANALLPELSGASAHGVPFTAPFDAQGLLSWGQDPPRKRSRVGTYVDDSWRIWVCNRLALALLSARTSTTPRPLWQCALALLWLFGVDPRTWTPRRLPFYDS